MATKLSNSASRFLPRRRSLRTLRQAARCCEGCDLYKTATQTVFGEGPPTADVVFVGEQPGDQEDQQGRPFVGPAGRLLEKVLADARILREQVYVTNAVKHFKWIRRGKRRLHQKPAIRQVTACRVRSRTGGRKAEDCGLSGCDGSASGSRQTGAYY